MQLVRVRCAGVIFGVAVASSEARPETGSVRLRGLATLQRFSVRGSRAPVEVQKLGITEAHLIYNGSNQACIEATKVALKSIPRDDAPRPWIYAIDAFRDP